MAVRYSDLPFLGSKNQRLTRRDFLRFLSSGLVMSTMPPLLGCSGDSSSPANPQAGVPGNITGSGVEGTPVTQAQRLAAIQAIEAEVSNLMGGGVSFDPDAMLTYLQQQLVFFEVGYSASSKVAWAVFTDGRKLMIMNNLDFSAPPPPVSKPGIKTSTRQSGEMSSRSTLQRQARKSIDDPLVTANQFRLINMWPTLPFMDHLHVTDDWVDEDTIPRIGRIASGLGLNVVAPGLVIDFGVNRPLIADVEGLKTVSGDGVFFLTGSGGTMETSRGAVQGICTMTPVREGEVLNEAYEADLDNGSLIYAIAIENPSTGPLTYFAITPQFIRQYTWSFPDESLVFLNVTGGGINNWLDALNEAGAGLVMGWSDSPQVKTMLGVAQDFFELVFATNHVSPTLFNLETEPRLRPYGMTEIYSFLVRRGLIASEVGGVPRNNLEMLPGWQGLFIDQLRPSIEYISVSEVAEEIYIQGMFGYETPIVKIGTSTEIIRTTGPQGNQPATELEFVADQPLSGDAENMSIIDAQAANIRLNLPSGSNLEAGMIQVWLGDRFSNVAHLTKWTVIFQVSRSVGASLLRSVTMEVSIRAFVSGYRLWPDQDLDEQLPLVVINNMSEFAIGWSASGSRSQSGGGTTITETWSGAGNYGQSIPTEFFTLNGLLWINTRRLDCMFEMLCG